MTDNPTPPMDGLKPCPFCGGAWELRTDGDNDGYMTTPKFAVRCKNCKCSSPYFGGYRNKNDCISDAIKAWNTRVPVSRPMPIDTHDDCRKAFEENTIRHCGNVYSAEEMLRSKPNGSYTDKLVNAAWISWQDCWALRTPPAQELTEDEAVATAKALFPDLWAHENLHADFMAKANCMTREAAHQRGDLLRRIKAAGCKIVRG